MLVPPSWTSLRSIGNSLAARSTVVMPLLGSAIIFDERIRVYVSRALGEENYAGVVGLKVVAIYFGLFAIGVGSLLYIVFAGELPKRYGTADEYLEAIAERIPRRRLIAMIAEIRRSGRVMSDFPVDLIAQQLQTHRGSDGERIASEIANAYFEFINTARPVARAATTALYLVGFFLTGCVALTTALEVGLIALHRFVSG